ncbi:biotin-dependent carboxyltransferase family protein [Herbaspirillum sp. RV1423]|uniref:5-oxoprolinase subunit C family protein n=1 Tax=Herbaspirillum sp. RV1423 TaxID=1443993 RepID=UPI0004B6B055|nr:biotin-dependent carboxyltransferase family protein [Herbaspirillum sp. RV1423]
MLEVIQPGLLTSVQDLGRTGHRQLGINPGGVLNTLALTAANLLVGNPAGTAGLEITMGACEFRFTADTRLALGGDDFDARLDGKPVAPYWSVPVNAGQILKLSNIGPGGAPGIRSYLAVAGGIDVPECLGSRSTDLKAGFGGHEGRALRKGDRLPLGEAGIKATGPAFGVRSPQWSGLGTHQNDSSKLLTLRVLPGPEYEQFTVAAKNALWQDKWRITPNSNRMGYRLEGPELKRKQSRDLLSHGVVPGVIQVPPSGQPIILMGDAQTTGGYPKIGVVIAADMWKLAQAPLNALLRLQPCDLEQALHAWEEQQRYLAHVQQTIAALDWSRATQYRK